MRMTNEEFLEEMAIQNQIIKEMDNLISGSPCTKQTAEMLGRMLKRICEDKKPISPYHNTCLKASIPFFDYLSRCGFKEQQFAQEFPGHSRLSGHKMGKGKS